MNNKHQDSERLQPLLSERDFDTLSPLTNSARIGVGVGRNSLLQRFLYQSDDDYNRTPNSSATTLNDDSTRSNTRPRDSFNNSPIDYVECSGYDGRFQAIAGNHDKTLLIKNDAEIIWEGNFDGFAIKSMHFTQEGEKLVILFESGFIKIFDTITLEIESLGCVDGNCGDLKCVSLSPDKTLVAVAFQRKILIFNVIDGYEYRRIKDLFGTNILVFSNDGKLLGLGGPYGAILYNLCCGKLHAKYNEGECSVSFLAFSYDGMNFALSDVNGRCYVYNIYTNQLLCKSKPKQNYHIESLLFHSDDTTLLTRGRFEGIHGVRDEEMSLYQSSVDSSLRILIGEGANDGNKQDEIIEKVKSSYFESSLHFDADGNALLHEAVRKGHQKVVCAILRKCPSHALIPIPNDNDGDNSEHVRYKSVFDLLEVGTRYRDLHQLFSTQMYGAITSDVQLDEMLNCILRLGKNHVSDLVTKGLLAGEEHCVPGFVVVNRTFLKFRKDHVWRRKKEANIRGLYSFLYSIKHWILSLFRFFRNTIRDLLLSTVSFTDRPLTFESDMQKPRSSSSSHDFSIFNDGYHYDEKKRIRLQVFRVLLPNLGSFESLKTLTQMGSIDHFDTPALDTVISAHWFTWARKKYTAVTLTYFAWTIVLTLYCHFQHPSYDKSLLQKDSVDLILTTFIVLGIFYFAKIEMMQFHHLHSGPYLSNIENYIHVFALLDTSIFLILDYQTTSPVVKAHLAALAQFFVWFGLLFNLRGSNRIAWIVHALLRISLEMIPFLIVIFVFVIMFTLAFRSLSRDDTVSDWSELDFSSLMQSILTTLFAGIFNYFELEFFLRNSYNRIATFLIMTFMLIVMSVISLNSLIALIGDSFERVLAQKRAVLNEERAKLILDMYTMMSQQERKEVEEKNRWTYKILPTSVFETMDVKKDGAEANLAKATKDDLKRLQRDLAADIRIDLDYAVEIITQNEAKKRKENTEMLQTQLISAVNSLQNEFKGDMNKVIEAISSISQGSQS